MSARSQPGGSSDGIDNFQLPKALVTRIARSALPHDAKLQKDTINSLVNGASVFINYLAATAQDVAASRTRKTIAGQDILKALEIIEFSDLVPILEAELLSYHEVAKADKGKGKGKEKGHSSSSLDTPAAQPNVAVPDETRQKDHESEPEHEILEDIEDQAEDGVDENIRMVEVEVQEEEEEEQEEEEEAGDEVEDDAADEPEDIVDTLAIEEAELQRDARGLEESGPQIEED